MRLHLTFVFVALCAAAPAAHAQSRLTANIPFAFAVGNQECPAGVWNIQQSASNPAILTIESRDGKHRFVVTATSVTRNDAYAPAQLVFNQYGAERFLSQVWRSQGPGSQLHPGGAERILIARQTTVSRVALVFAGSR